jgi:hypothetical protein
MTYLTQLRATLERLDSALEDYILNGEADTSAERHYCRQALELLEAVEREMDILQCRHDSLAKSVAIFNHTVDSLGGKGPVWIAKASQRSEVAASIASFQAVWAEVGGPKGITPSGKSMAMEQRSAVPDYIRTPEDAVTYCFYAAKDGHTLDDILSVTKAAQRSEDKQ